MWKIGLLIFLFSTSFAVAAPSHVLTLFGKPKYSKDFKHFAYVNPEAPKGGSVRLASVAPFDSLNPFIIKGTPADGLSNYVFESLLVGSLDEPQSYYGLLADSVDIAKDKSSAIFTINPKARWHDGEKVTPEDVVFSLNILKEKGAPQYQLLFQPISAAIIPNKNAVIFHFAEANNRDLPFLAASMPVLSKKYYSKHAFEKTSLEPPMGSGPYQISKVEAGRFIVYKKVEKYWGKDLPVRVGQFNFSDIRFDVYRDETVSLEALKAHAYDFREEYIARNWATAYDTPALAKGELIKKLIPNKIPSGIQGFIFNLRRPQFADRRVREAIGLCFDFEWMNRALFYDAYKRSKSLFQNSDFAARSLPSAAELQLLEPYRKILPPEVFNEIYDTPHTDGSGNVRENLLKAQQLLNDAGWRVKDGIRVNAAGEPLKIEFLMSQATLQRMVLPILKNLKRLGIQGSFRLIDEAQYQKRMERKDFDITSVWWNLGLQFPGAEQAAFWYSKQADVRGSSNYSGLNNPAVDAILSKLSQAKNIAELKTSAHALDRVIMHEHIMIPQIYIGAFRFAWWDIFGIPRQRPDYASGFDSWWIK